MILHDAQVSLFGAIEVRKAGICDPAEEGMCQGTMRICSAIEWCVGHAILDMKVHMIQEQVIIFAPRGLFTRPVEGKQDVVS